MEEVSRHDRHGLGIQERWPGLPGSPWQSYRHPQGTI
jgi:hypothetical protein